MSLRDSRSLQSADVLPPFTRWITRDVALVPLTHRPAAFRQRLRARKSTGSASTIPVGTPDPAVQSARSAGLRYVMDGVPGIRRRGTGPRFQYVGPDGNRVRDRDTLDRIAALVVPPAWHDVWICPFPNGHIQVTARDAKGRKQYRYHADWRAVRDGAKYEHMLGFARALPLMRRRVAKDLALPGLPRPKILATVVKLLETTMMRVGNEDYARTNHTFGLASLRNRHVKVSGPHLRFSFRGKSGKQHFVELHDERIAKIVKRCIDIPGYELFQYLDESGARHRIDAADVNEYLRAISGADYTAKDFRTWAGTKLVVQALLDQKPALSRAQRRSGLVAAIRAVASILGNTPAICRKCYIHPAVLTSYLEGSMQVALGQRTSSKRTYRLHDLSQQELAVVDLLEKQPRGRESGRS
jgi:DNA topoisomerase I